MFADLKIPPKLLLREMLAGFAMSVISVPGSIANGVLAGVNPIFGIYSTIVGTTVAALSTSSVIMNVDTTGATALATGNVLDDKLPVQHLGYLVVIVLLVGVFQLLFGLLNLGNLTNFISDAVMTGFILGVAIQAIIGQAGDITGYYSDVSNKILRLFDTVINFREIDLPTLGIGLLTILLIVVVERTKFASYAYLVGLSVTTFLVRFVGFGSVAVVGDTVTVPSSLLQFNIPDMSLVVGLILPAFAIAIIGLVQSAGVSGSIPNPNGRYPDPSVDFRGQGVANIATGLFGGLPVGGSLSGTAVIRSVGGRTRWANIFTGIFSLVMVLLFANLIEALPLSAIAGLIVMAGLSIINVPRIKTVWRTGKVPTVIMVITFVGTLLMPIHYAVFMGVFIHVLIYVFQSAVDVRIEQIIKLDDGQYAEIDLPAQLPSNTMIILQPVGSIFFAGAARLDALLPEVGQARRTAVILRLRDRGEVDSTFIRVVARYDRALQANDCKLFLAGLNERVREQLEDTDLLNLIGPENVFLSQPRFGASVEEAIVVAEEWLAAHNEKSEVTTRV